MSDDAARFMIALGMVFFGTMFCGAEWHVGIGVTVLTYAAVLLFFVVTEWEDD